MIGEGIAERLAGMKCPDCGARQAIYTRAGFKSRVRPPHHAEACPGCGAVLHMVHAPGGAFREGLGWGVALVVLVGAAMVGVPAEGSVTPAMLWAGALIGAALLYLFALAATGLIIGWTRQMVKP